jgi:ATP-binding cassette subfamily F protein 3
MHSVELLAEALNKYEGSYILVSHDRYFISKTANKIWEIVDGEIKEFKGTYAEWVAWNERMAMKAKNEEGEKQKVEAVKEEVKGESKKAEGKPINKELQKLQRKMANLENDIERIKAEKIKLEADMSNPSTYSNNNGFTALEKAYADTNSKLSTMNSEYEQLFESIMAMEGN